MNSQVLGKQKGEKNQCVCGGRGLIVNKCNLDRVVALLRVSFC